MARILLVDDEADFRHSAAEILGLSGHEIREAATVNDAQEFLKSETFHAVLTDLRMPGAR